MEMDLCDFCKLFIQHINILLYENSKDSCESNLSELKNYYRLSNIFDVLHEDCNICRVCFVKGEYSMVVESLKAVLLKNRVELNNENMKCDICKVLHAEIFVLLDMMCNIDSSLESVSSLYDELQYQGFLADITETVFGKCYNCGRNIDYYHTRNILSRFLENRNVESLKQEVHAWKVISTNDDIINAANKVARNSFKTVQKIGYIDKSTIYLDFNIFDVYEKNDDFKQLLNSTKAKGVYQFVYSPIHMEEICRMDNNEFEAKRFESIHKLTDKVEVLQYDGVLTFCTEDLNDCFDRAKRCSEINSQAEVKNCIHNEERSLFFDKYTGELYSKMINESSLLEMINNISKSDAGKKIKEELPNEVELNEILRGVCFLSCEIKDFKNLYSENITYSELRTAINSISHIFNVLGYNSDKVSKKNEELSAYPVYRKDKYRTVRSNTYDVNHLCYATRCSYFVTNDKKLLKRAKEIYNYIGCKTKVISYDEMIELLR